jgi:hypothetical protein
MIRLILRGRTGNILFQYALGRVLAAKHGVPLLLGAHWYNREGWAEVSHLLNLPLKAEVARGGLPCSIAARAFRKAGRKHFWEYLGKTVLREDPFDQSFDPRFADAPADCVIYGYFQSPRYFEGMADELRTELNGLLTQGVGASCPQSVVQKLTQPNSIAVHVRRGDFQRIPTFNVCDESYYRQSMGDMRTRIPGARFFIFSDDPEWCRDAFREKDAEVIDSGAASANPLHDLHLMSLASHHIIANSSYSWWAAWLGDKPGQQVIMPERWYAREIQAPMEEKRWK